ncbi:MerR family transcriptional regulator [Latilactobacillus sakei]
MNYQIKAFAELTGVSERTLRYYHERGLLVPAVASNGYRSYSSQDADRLQLILMYRQLQFSLAEIQQLLALPPAERLTHLAAKRDELTKQTSSVDGDFGAVRCHPSKSNWRFSNDRPN